MFLGNDYFRNRGSEKFQSSTIRVLSFPLLMVVFINSSCYNNLTPMAHAEFQCSQILRLDLLLIQLEFLLSKTLLYRIFPRSLKIGDTCALRLQFGGHALDLHWKWGIRFVCFFTNLTSYGIFVLTIHKTIVILITISHKRTSLF